MSSAPVQRKNATTPANTGSDDGGSSEKKRPVEERKRGLSLQIKLAALVVLLGGFALYRFDLFPSIWQMLVGLVALAAFAYYRMQQSPAMRSFPFVNAIRKPGYRLRDIPDLTGKVIIVTGATTGLGKESVIQLYKRNAHVILCARTMDKGEEAKRSIIASVGATKGKIDPMVLELHSLKSVRSFAAEFKKKGLPLHVLLLNAGVMATPFQLTDDGIEMQFGVNHVAHQALTMELLDLLKASAPSRIVSLTSDGHSFAGPYGVFLNLEDINSRDKYNPFRAYGQSKLAIILFVRELAHRLNGTGVLVNAVHPGFVHTGIMRPMLGNKLLPPFLLKLFPFLQKYVAYSPEAAVVTQLYAAVAPEVEEKQYNGEYFAPLAVLERQFGHAKVHDHELQTKLWSFTQELIAARK